MKKALKILFVISFIIGLNFSVFSQSTPPPPPPHGDEGGAVGGGAPIGDGTSILILLATGYLLIRLRKYRLKEKC